MKKVVLALGLVGAVMGVTWFYWRRTSFINYWVRALVLESEDRLGWPEAEVLGEAASVQFSELGRTRQYFRVDGKVEGALDGQELLVVGLGRKGKMFVRLSYEDVWKEKIHLLQPDASVSGKWNSVSPRDFSDWSLVGDGGVFCPEDVVRVVTEGKKEDLRNGATVTPVKVMVILKSQRCREKI